MSSRQEATVLRNCDVGTPEERLNRYGKYWEAHSLCPFAACGCEFLWNSKSYGDDKCKFCWDGMPYESEADNGKATQEDRSR